MAGTSRMIPSARLKPAGRVEKPAAKAAKEVAAVRVAVAKADAAKVVRAEVAVARPTLHINFRK